MTRFSLLFFGMVVACGVGSAADPESCSYRRTTPDESKPATALVTRSNWLAVENLRIGLQAPQKFMPGVFMRNTEKKGLALTPASPPIDIDVVKAVDPYDENEKSLRFLLDTRLYADGIIVLSSEQILLEHFRTGFTADSARLLLEGTRPFLTTLLAAAADRGRFSRDKSVVRLLPELAHEASLRKTSVQRLLDGRTGLEWTPEDRRQWLSASGWGPVVAKAPAGVRAWLKGRKSWPRDDALPVSEVGGPEGELLVWVLQNASKQPVSRLLCESVLAAIGAEDEAFWATDPSGTELADGLALSLRDLARFGLALIDARGRAGTASVAPRWFAESLAFAVTHKDPPPEQLRSLGEDSAWRYRFVSLGTAHEAAIVGPFGDSLFLDFDRRIVVAVYASFPKDYSPLMLRSLRSVWSGLETAVQARVKNP